MVQGAVYKAGHRKGGSARVPFYAHGPWVVPDSRSALRRSVQRDHHQRLRRTPCKQQPHLLGGDYGGVGNVCGRNGRGWSCCAVEAGGGEQVGVCWRWMGAAGEGPPATPAHPHSPPPPFQKRKKKSCKHCAFCVSSCYARRRPWRSVFFCINSVSTCMKAAAAAGGWVGGWAVGSLHFLLLLLFPDTALHRTHATTPWLLRARRTRQSHASRT